MLRIAYTIRERQNEEAQKKNKKTQENITGTPVRADPQSVREGMNWDVEIEEGYREKPSEVKKIARALPDAKSDGCSSGGGVFRERRSRLESKIVLPELVFRIADTIRERENEKHQ